MNQQSSNVTTQNERVEVQSPADVESLYGELRLLAGHLLRQEQSGHTLQPTALVHEAFLRLAGFSGAGAELPPLSFLRIATRVMRQVLADHARRRNAQKRNGGARPLPLMDEIVQSGLTDQTDEVDLLALDEALEQFEGIDPRAAALVDLRFFAGLTVPEAATIMHVSVATAEADWRIAKAWLARALSTKG